MATINRLELLADIEMYMRSDNLISDTQMKKISEKIITDVGDDDEYYEEILCKSLTSIALANKSKATETGQYKVIKTDNLWEEFHKGKYSNSWDGYLDSLDAVCASFGYTELDEYSTGCMVINSGGTTPLIDNPPVDVNPTSSTSTSVTGYYL